MSCLERYRIKDGIKTVMAISKLGNQYLQDNKHWEVFKSDPGRSGGLLLVPLGLTAVLAALIRPYMPSITTKILAQMDLDEREVRRGAGVPPRHWRKEGYIMEVYIMEENNSAVR